MRNPPSVSLCRRRFSIPLLVVFVLCVSGAGVVVAHSELPRQIEQLTVSIRANPGSAALYLERGEQYRREQHWNEALADFDTAQQLEPGNMQAELGRGLTWFDRGDYQRAIGLVDRVVSAQPDNARARLTRATALRMSGDPLAAAAEYAQLIQLFAPPDNPLPEYYYEHARALEAAGTEYVDAALHSLDAGCVRLGAIRVLQDYAVALERGRGNYEAALHRLDRIIGQSARKESLLLARGDLQRASGMSREAEQSYAAALAAIDALPARHRNSRLMVDLRNTLEQRMLSPVQPGADG